MPGGIASVDSWVRHHSNQNPKVQDAESKLDSRWLQRPLAGDHSAHPVRKHSETHLDKVSPSIRIHEERDEGSARRLGKQQRLKCSTICLKSRANQQLQNGGDKCLGAYHERTMESN